MTLIVGEGDAGKKQRVLLYTLGPNLLLYARSRYVSAGWKAPASLNGPMRPFVTHGLRSLAGHSCSATAWQDGLQPFGLLIACIIASPSFPLLQLTLDLSKAAGSQSLDDLIVTYDLRSSTLTA